MPPPEVSVMTLQSSALPLEMEYTGQTAGSRETEVRVKAETGATIRCIPLPDQGFEEEPGTCMITGAPSKRRVIWAKAY